MNTEDLIVQRPAMPSRLVLLFHGVGSSASDLAPLGAALALHDCWNEQPVPQHLISLKQYGNP